MNINSNNRKFDGSVNDDVKSLLGTLVDKGTNSEQYKNTMLKLGQFMGKELLKKLDPTKKYCVASTVEDADFLANGIIDSIKDSVDTVYLACFWNDRFSNVAPIYNKYLDKGVENSHALIVVKSIMSGSCVVKTNITALINQIEASEIFVLAPVMHKDSQKKLEKEFPEQISNRFDYFSLAIDECRDESGEVLPGIGGSVYERLGFKGQSDKNKYLPNIVQKRIFAF